MTGVQIDPETMQTVVAKAIMEGISQEQRDLVIEQAVRSLLTPAKDHLNRPTGQTPLQQAFDQAVHRACVRAADELLAENQEFQARLKGLFSDTVKAAMDRADWDLQRRISEAVMLAVLAP